MGSIVLQCGFLRCRAGGALGTCHVPQNPHFRSAFERFLFFSASWAFRSSCESGNGPASGFSAGGGGYSGLA